MNVSRSVWIVALGTLMIIAAFAVSASGVVGAFAPASHPSHSTGSGPGWNSSTPAYNVTFEETGLPAGTNWSVTVASAGGWAHVPAWSGGRGYHNSTNGSIGFVLSNGTYFFSVASVQAGGTLYAPSPAHGNFTVNGSAVTEAVSFAPVRLYSLVFSETGLPNGTFWSVSLGGGSPYGGSASPQVVSPACHGTGWNGSANSTVNFTEPNGTYSFGVGQAYSNGVTYLPTPAVGNVTVNGSTATVSVQFAPQQNFTITFQESGLPNGTFWSVGLSGGYGGGWPSPFVGTSPLCDQFGWNGSTNSSIGFSVPDGTYSFQVGTAGGNGSATVFVPSPQMGNVTVNGTNVTVPVTFTPLVLYNVTFDETGLPSGTFWSVGLFNASVGGAWNGSSNASVNFTLPDGVYGFWIGNATNGSTVYVPSPTNGTVVVNGSSVVVAVDFSPVTLYNVTFVESGLPAGTNWTVFLFNDSVGGLCNSSANASLTFFIPNGSYNFSVGNVSNGTVVFVPTPANGSLTVNGSGATVLVEFGAVQLDNLTFNETGLPSGTEWFVALYAPGEGWSFNSSNTSNVSFLVPNGTYGFEIGIGWSSGGYYNATPAVGTVNVTATNVTVHVAFSFTSVPGGTPWSSQGATSAGPTRSE